MKDCDAFVFNDHFAEEFILPTYGVQTDRVDLAGSDAQSLRAINSF